MNIKFLVVFVIILSYLISVIDGAEWVHYFHNPKYPGKCSVSPVMVLNKGVSVKDPNHKCRQIICGHNEMTIFQSCGISALTPPCRYGEYENIDLPYPKCCLRQIICN